MTKKQPILLTEAHHGGILVSFYKAIMDLCGKDRGYDLFMTASGLMVKEGGAEWH